MKIMVIGTHITMIILHNYYLSQLFIRYVKKIFFNLELIKTESQYLNALQLIK